MSIKYDKYMPFYTYLSPASIPQIVAHIQNYLVKHPILSVETIAEIIVQSLQEHPELINGTAIPISADSEQSIKAYIDSLPSIDTYTKAEINTLLTGKQDTLTFDQAPTPGSSNPVTSSGIIAAMSAMNEALETLIEAKADSASTYTKSQVDTLLTDKANTDDVYSKNTMDAKLLEYATSDSVYSKADINTMKQVNKANLAIVSSDGTAPLDISAGQYVYMDDVMFMATEDILTGARLIPNTNIVLNPTGVTNRIGDGLKNAATQITGLAGRMTQAEGAISSQSQQINTLNSAVKRQISGIKKVILIGDSYGVDNDMWTGWQTAFNNLNAYLVYKSAIGGSGLKGDPNVDDFLTQLQSLESTVTAPDEITDIVFMGGYNDASLSYSEPVLLTEMGNITAYCRNKYKYARIHYGFIAVSYRSDGMQNTLNIYREIFARICNKFMVHFIPNAWCILLNRGLLYMDKSNANWGFHPNTAGGVQVAEHLTRYLTSGYSDVTYVEVKNFIGKISFYNGEVTITPSSNYPFHTKIPAGVYAYNTWVDIVDLDAESISLLWGTYHEGLAYESWAYLYELKDAGNPVTWVKIRLYNKKIQIKNLTHGTGLTLTNTGYIYANGFYIPAELNFN